MSLNTMSLNAASSMLGIELIENGKGTQALHETVVAYRANRRAGTHSTLTIGTVAATGKKMYRQKGTGNARAGLKSSPIRRGGGVVFGPHPRDYSKKTSKRVKRLALIKAISEAAKSGKLASAPVPKLEAARTKEAVTWMDLHGIAGSALIVSKEVDRKLVLSTRNIPGVKVIDAAQLNAEDILRPKYVVILDDAFETLAGRLKKSK
jgi:large subunit ribosomal protein L4